MVQVLHLEGRLFHRHRLHGEALDSHEVAVGGRQQFVIRFTPTLTLLHQGGGRKGGCQGFADRHVGVQRVAGGPFAAVVLGLPALELAVQGLGSSVDGSPRVGGAALGPQEVSADVQRNLHHHSVLLRARRLGGHLHLSPADGRLVAVKGGELGGHVLLHRAGNLNIPSLDIQVHLHTSHS